jgi:hypothetical protein
MNVAAILKAAQAATALADLYTRAAAAAENGDQDAAQAYLDEARARYDVARSAWDAA